MKTLVGCSLILVVFGLISGKDLNQIKGSEIIVPESQVMDKYFEVFVPDISIYDEMDPQLYLMDPNIEREKASGSRNVIKHYLPKHIIRDYQMKVPVENTDKSDIKNGSLLFFDLSELKIPFYTPGITVQPVFIYTPALNENEESAFMQNKKQIKLITKKDILIGNRTGAWFWTGITFLIFLIFVFLLTKHDGKPIIGLVCTKDETLSMSLLQLGIWTIVVGFMVLSFGLLQHKVPKIPPSLLILLTASVVTGTIGHFQTNSYLRKSEKIAKQPRRRTSKYDFWDVKTKPKFTWSKFAGLWQTVFYFPDSTTSNKDSEPSLAKAQIFFWTLVTVILFVVKSMREGELWDIPEEFVALMGLSQITFLSRKEQGRWDLKKDIDVAEEAKKKAEEESKKQKGEGDTEEKTG